MDFVIGVLSGFFVSVVIWLYARFFSPPKIKFEDSIIRRTYEDGKKGYFIQYSNTGRRRLIDPEVQVAIYVPGLVENKPNRKQVVFIDTTAKDRLFIDTKDKLSTPISSKLLFNESQSIQSNRLLPEDFKNRAKRDDFELEEFFNLGSNVYIATRIVGSDEMTGVRKLFESGFYRQTDIDDEATAVLGEKRLKASSIQDLLKKLHEKLKSYYQG